MLVDLQLPSLQDRRKTNRLVFLYKVVEGNVTALQSHDFWLLSGENVSLNRKIIKTVWPATSLTDSLQITANVLNPCSATLNFTETLSFREPPPPPPPPIIDWNHLDDSAVRAETADSLTLGLVLFTALSPLQQRWKALQRIHPDPDLILLIQ